VGLRALELGAQLMLRTISKIAGGQVVADTVQFFTHFEGMEEGFRERAATAEQLLRSELTSFALVCSPRRDSMEEALYLVSQLAASGARPSTVVVNRCYPLYPQVPPGAAAALAGSPLAPLLANLEELGTVAATESDQLARITTALPDATLYRVPFMARDVYDLDGLAEVADHLES